MSKLKIEGFLEIGKAIPISGMPGFYYSIVKKRPFIVNAGLNIGVPHGASEEEIEQTTKKAEEITGQKTAYLNIYEPDCWDPVTGKVILRKKRLRNEQDRN